MDQHIEIFERIAPVYQWFFHWQVRSYLRILKQHQARLGITQGGRVLDIGCGTGAFACSLQRLGYNVTGVDASPAMVRHCKRNAVCCLHADVAEGLPFPDGDFDLVVCSYVAHGLPHDKRKRLFREAARLASAKVILHDFHRRGNPLVDVLERLEKGDYFNFLVHGLAEMREVFPEVEVVPVNHWTCWYICTPSRRNL